MLLYLLVKLWIIVTIKARIKHTHKKKNIERKEKALHKSDLSDLHRTAKTFVIFYAQFAIIHELY